MLLGLTLKLLEKYSLHCSESITCPLSNVLVNFILLAISSLYLFFTFNIGKFLFGA